MTVSVEEFIQCQQKNNKLMDIGQVQTLKQTIATCLMVFFCFTVYSLLSEAVNGSASRALNGRTRVNITLFSTK
jgi:preprotein translocase subunit SecF